MTVHKTLKGRFSIFAVVLVIVSAAAAEYAQENVKRTSDVIANNLSNRHDSRNFSQQIHAGLFDSYKNLSAFLLDPTRTQLRVEINRSIENAITASQKLLDIDLSDGSLQASTNISEITLQLKNLHNKFTEVLNTRVNSLEQYPSLGIANLYLRPNRILFVNSIAVAFNEINESENEVSNEQVYKHFVVTRQLWMQMLSNFRLYLANRLGSFNEQSLILQENGIEQTYKTLIKSLRAINEMDKHDLLGFETTDALIDINKSVSDWFKGFLVIKKVHHSGKWRTDVNLLKQNIEPQLTSIVHLLENLNLFFEATHHKNLEELRNATIQQSQYMWFVFSSVVLFFLFFIFFFETLILRPIKVVAEAMKAVSYGEVGVKFPTVAIKETQSLMDAFNQMRAQIRSRQFELEHQSLHDSLTGLANRTLLRDRLNQAINAAKREGSECALLILNVDRFKDINESFGHQIGDLLLIEVSTKIEQILKETDTIARLSGDEFAILLQQSNEEHTRNIIEKIEHILQSIRSINNAQVYVSGTIGAVQYPAHGNNANNLLKHADVALHVAKNTQRPSTFYSENVNNVTPNRLALTNDLRNAIDNHKLYLEYQPQVDFKTKKVIEVEALIRWRHPQLGNIDASQIISIAEQTGQINAITHWVIQTAAKQCATWRSEGRNFGMAINLSVLNLEDSALIDEISRCVSMYDLSYQCLTFEITESAMMINPIAALKTLKRLEALGLRLVIDDFGTGFSSLSYLKQLPVEKLKLDKSFVISLDKDSDDEVIVRSTIELAHNLGIQVVAEGVENKASWKILKRLKCDYAQGFYLSKSKSADDLNQWITSKDKVPALD